DRTPARDAPSAPAWNRYRSRALKARDGARQEDARMAHQRPHEALTSQLTEAAARLLPRGPREAGVPSRELELEEVEGAQLLGNEAQPVLSAVGFSAVAIREWADAFFVRHHAGDV